MKGWKGRKRGERVKLGASEGRGEGIERREVGSARSDCGVSSLLSVVWRVSLRLPLLDYSFRAPVDATFVSCNSSHTSSASRLPDIIATFASFAFGTTCTFSRVITSRCAVAVDDSLCVWSFVCETERVRKVK